MKVINKLFVIALLLSLIFSISAIAAADSLENMTFEQSNMEDVSIETLNVPSEDTQEINTVEDDSSVNDAEDRLQASDDDVLSADSAFSDIQSKINSASAGSNIYLEGKTYVPFSSTNSIDVTKSLTFIGGTSSNPNQYATIDGKNLATFSVMVKSGKITFRYIKFINGQYALNIDEATTSVVVENCIFSNNKNTNAGTAIWNNCNNLQVKDSTFNDNNGANGNGSVIQSTKPIKVYNCEFNNNKGTCIYTYGDGNSVVSGCTFYKNYAYLFAPAIDARGTKIDVSKCNFVSNSGEYDGCVALKCDYNNIENSNFTQNKATSTKNAQGGAIYSYGKTLNVKGCEFTSNSATHSGGAIYSATTISNTFENNDFTKNTAGDGSGSMYIKNASNTVLKGNTFTGDKGIIMNNPNTNGLKIIVLQNKTLKAFEGDIKLYAQVLSDDGIQYSMNDFTFLVGNKKVSANLVNNVAEVTYNAKLQDNGAIVSVNIPKATIQTGRLEIVKYDKVIDFEDAVGLKGGSVTVPVHVHDTLGYALTGSIKYIFNGEQSTAKLNSNGKVNLNLKNLPNEEITLDLVISYEDVLESRKVKIIDPSDLPVEDDNVVIELPESGFGYTGYNVTVPVYLYHKVHNDPLKGNITYTYNGVKKTIALQNGRANITLNLPETPMMSNLTVSYQNVSKYSKIEVVNPNEHVTIDLEETIEGNISQRLVVPVFVHDDNNNALNGEITITYPGHNKVDNLVDGKINIEIPLPDSPTTFKLEVSYHGVKKVANIKVTDPVRPHNENATVIISLPENESGHVGKTIIVPVSVRDIDGNDMEGDIEVSYGNNKENITLRNGEAEIVVILPSNPTEFDLTVKYNNVTAVCRIIVEKENNQTLDDNTVVIEVDDEITGHIGKVLKIPVYVHDGKGNPLIGDINVIYNTQRDKYTLKDGKATIYIGLPTYPATVYFTVLFEEISKDAKVIVVDPNNPMGDINKTESDNGSVVIGFPKDATGDVIVNINGKNYTGKVVNGQVVLDVKDLPAGNYESIVYYSGDGNYSSSTKTIMVIVKENSNNKTIVPNVHPPAVTKKISKFSAKKKTFKAAKKVKKYKVTLKSGKAPIKNVPVTIKIGKKTYKAITNVKGKATFKIKKLTKVGKYKAVVNFKGDSQYKPTTKKVKITVK